MSAVNGIDGRKADAVAKVETERPDLVLLDRRMAHANGREGGARLARTTPDPLVTADTMAALGLARERMKALELAALEFLTRPINEAQLVWFVRSLLRIRALHDIVQAQAAELAYHNRCLERQVQEQVAQLERLGRLKRFFSPQLAELIQTDGADDPLKPHRREVTVVFLDLRGFTAFAETSEPEEVIRVLREYHAEMGRLILAHEATLERFTGDGMMVFFNDPVPVPRPEEHAIRMVFAMRDRVAELTGQWRKRGYELDLGVGIAHGYATIGAIGFEGRWDYAAVGTVTNLAARLCGEAKPGEILVSRRFLAGVEHLVRAEPVGELTLKGFLKPMPAFKVFAPTGRSAPHRSRRRGRPTGAPV